ncbi:DUF4240 domain-containing protein [Micromonospora sp. NPDC050397]|uniref:DUF4240 domain-containing protein n=1 Tax=Micromonospora sp. NPDC050397 TaxID=3364279 RepID=UPI00384D24E2
MNVDEFWFLLEASRSAGAKRKEREAFLRQRLWRAPRPHLLDFVQHLSGTREPANTYRLWRAADIIMGEGCGTDSFHYFQMWLVGLGRDVYEAAIADPDSLATAPEVRRIAALPRPWPDDDYPSWESLEYVAWEIGNQRDDIDGDIRDVLTDERGVRPRMDPGPDDIEWRLLNTEDVSRRHPRLWALFGERGVDGC